MLTGEQNGGYTRPGANQRWLPSVTRFPTRLRVGLVRVSAGLSFGLVYVHTPGSMGVYAAG